jgi:hypothetical protein
MRNKPVFPNLRNVKGVITPEGEALTLKTCESCVPAALRGGRLFLCLWDLIPVLLASPGLRFDKGAASCGGRISLSQSHAQSVSMRQVRILRKGRNEVRDDQEFHSN